MYYPRYIIFNVPVHTNATITTVSSWFSSSTFLSEGRILKKLLMKFSLNGTKFQNVFLILPLIWFLNPPPALRLHLVPDVRSLLLCEHLHDPGRHCGEIHRRVSASPVQAGQLCDWDQPHRLIAAGQYHRPCPTPRDSWSTSSPSLPSHLPSISQRFVFLWKKYG